MNESEIAHARLVAAAPKLLAALEAYLDYNGDRVRDPDTTNWDSPKQHPVLQARAAIAAAKGLGSKRSNESES